MKCLYASVPFLLFLLPAGDLAAQLRLDAVFSDHMVWQRDRPVTIRGKADPGEGVTVIFGGGRHSTVATADSTWRLQLGAYPAGTEAKSMQVFSATDTLLVNDILIGDVYLCFGQSNMEWPIQREQHVDEAMRDADQFYIRWLNPTYAGKHIYGITFTDSVAHRLQPADFYQGHWEPCDSSSLPGMSAVAYYFAQRLQAETGIPVGLINLAIGGAPLETFVPVRAMREDPRFAAKVTGDWLHNDALPVWVRERGQQNVGALTHAGADELGKNHAFKPGFAFEAGIRPLFGFPVKGMLFYQGESNAQEWARVAEYGALCSLMVATYREGWGQPRLPFYFVQLSSIDTVRYKGQLWGHFRDEQRKMLDRIPHSGMAVCSDIGARNDVHPTNKRDVGYRLARLVLHDLYGRSVCPSGPLPRRARYANGVIRISFRQACGGLQASGHQPLRGFSLDRRGEAPAEIVNNRVWIKTDTRPDAVYYGFAPYSEGNLINAAGLPASTFKIPVK